MGSSATLVLRFRLSVDANNEGILPPPENLIVEKEKIYKLKPLGYLYLDIQGILKTHVPKSGW